MSLIKAMATVGGLTGVSRILGFARDVLMAIVLGAGPVSDAFFVALKLPNFFRRVTAEGAFSVSFVPLYTEAMEKEGRAQANEFAGHAMGIMFWVLLLFTIIIMAAMPFVIDLIAPGFKDDPFRHDLATTLSRITFPYLLMMSMAALLGGVLNAHGRFAPFAAAPILFNLSLIALLLLAWKFETPGHALAWGVLIAGVLQFVVLWVIIRREGIKVRLRKPQIDARIKRLFRLMGPGVLGAGVMHINLFADMIMGSLLPAGSISFLYYADRLNQLPLGIVGVAVGTALLPMLSRAMAAGKTEESRNLFNRAMEACLFLALPAAMGLFVASYPIIVTLFRHGAFDQHAALMTTQVVTTYAVGMPAYIASKVYFTAFWAQQDTATPVKISVACTLTNIVLALWLIYGMHMGVVGIAAATSTAGWMQFGLLALLLRKREAVRLDERFKNNFVKIVACCAAMGAYLFVAKALLHGFYDGIGATHFTQITTLVILVGGGGAVYALGISMTGVVRLGDIKRFFKPEMRKVMKD
jgi:putative peptidoglycan lipid II flippase